MPVLLASCNGKVSSPEEQPAVYRIELPSRTFTPEAGVSASELAPVRETLQSEGVERAHLFLQLRKDPQPDARERLAQQGVELLSQVNRVTWYASVTKQGLEALPEVPDVRWAGPIQPEDKLSAALQDPYEPATYNKRDDGRLIFSVAFFPDVSAKQAGALVERLGGEAPQLEPRTFSVLRSTLLYLEKDKLRNLASADIVSRVEPGPPPDMDHNRLNAQPLSNVDAVQPAPFNLDGTGVAVGIWEAGDTVYANHLDLTPRVTVEAGQTANNDDHAAHVAGTIGASGANVTNAEGMAPNVNMSSWDSVNDANEMINAATSPGGAGNPVPIQISNHSYGGIIGWSGNTFNNNQNLFGLYNIQSQNYDNVVAQNGLIVVKSAGNDRNDFATPGSPNPSDCQQGGFGVAADCIGPRAVAKNVITVGAMSGAGAIAGFSSFGPTDDGRIKPDLMAHGVSLLSLACNCFDDRNGDGVDDVPNSTTSNRTLSGTSMSTPVVSGITALVMEEANNLDINMTPAAMKAVLIQTAQDVVAGPASPGPDFATGWGIADAEAAVNLLRENGLEQGTLASTGLGSAWTRQFYVPAGEDEVHLTLAWDDPAGTPGGQILVNDLDLRLIAPDGTVFTPWSLDPTNPGNAAVRNGGNDNTNNVEQVSVQTPDQGVWTVRVSANAGNLPQAPQNFAVAGALPHSDVVMVMDRSGSMQFGSGAPGISKIEALQNAANEFVDLLDIGGGHRLGLVQFNESVVPFSPPFDLQALTAANRPDAHTAINGMSAGGLTNIIGGVNEADSQLSSITPAFPRQAVVVFSDGKHNRPLGSDLNDIDATISGGGYRFYSIGFGTDVDDAILSSVAANSGGVHVNEQDLSPIQLTKYFLTVGALVHDMTVVSDPTFQVAPGDTASLSTNASVHDQSLTFAVNWIGQSARQVELQLLSPSRQCKVPVHNGPGMQVREGKRYKLVRVELPYHCRGEKIHAGTWTIRAHPREFREEEPETIDLMVLADSRLSLDTRARLEGGDVIIDTRVMLGGKAMDKLKAARGELVLTLPAQRRIDSEKLDRAGTEGEQIEYEPPVDRGQRIQRLKLQPVKDNKRPSQFRTVIDADDLPPGLLQGRTVVSIDTGERTLTRESTTSLYIPE